MRFFQDLRYTVRQLASTRAFTLTAVLTLALGIGGQTLFFAAVNAMIFRPLRATHVDGLYVINFINRQGGISGSLSAEQFRRLEADPPPAIARLGAIASWNARIVAWLPGRAERLRAEVVSSGCLLALDLVPQVGRLFVAEDDVPDASPAVIISDRIWREWFDGDRAIAGQAILRLNGVPFNVIGVAPRGYQGLAAMTLGTADIWITPTAGARISSASEKRWLVSGYWTTLIRPRADATRVEAETAIRTLLTSARGDPDAAMVTVRLTPADSYFGQNRLTTVGVVIISLAGLLLLAACANLANMLFARGAERAGEVAVRLSLGASRLRIFRLFMMESTLLAVLAAMLGVVIALGSTSLLGAALPSFQSRNFRWFIDLTPDYRVFLFAFSAGVAAALGVGMAVAWRASAVPLLQTLSSSGVAAGATRRSHKLRVGLVAVQVTAAVLLLMGAGLYLRMTEKELDRYVIFDTTRLATAVVDLRLHGYHESQGRDFFARALRDVSALPGVERAAIADGFPGGPYSPPRPVLIRTDKEVRDTDGGLRRIEGSHRQLTAGYVGVSPGFLDTIGLPLRRGRDISSTDQDSTSLVAIVSESVAQVLWPGQDAIGKTLMFGSDGHWRTVAGICGDPIAAQVESPLVSPANLVLIPAAQSYRPEMLTVVRSRTPAAVLERMRMAIRAIDENVAAFDVATADASIMSWAAPLHAATILTASVGLLALAIATLGVYGVVSYVVSLRTREFGIRLALGARPAQVIKLVVDDALYLLLVGLLAGVFFTSVAERYLQSQRVRFMPNEISTWVAVLLSILFVGLAAAYVPARRASRIDPNVALRDL